MNASGSEKFKIPVFKMKKNLDYEKIESSDDSLRHLNVEPKVNLNLGESIRRVESKPILFIQVPRREHETFEKLSDGIEKQLNEVGWFLLWAYSNKDEYEIQSFTLKDSQEVQVQELKEIILNDIKGK